MYCRRMEREQVLFGWNTTQAEYPSDRCMHELFEAQVRAHANCGGSSVRGTRR